MINFTVYSADCVGNSGNCLYPNKNVVTDKESFIAATKTMTIQRTRKTGLLLLILHYQFRE